MSEVKAFKVYHANRPTFGMEPAPKYPDDYTLVAVVTTAGGIEDVFRLTNHIDTDWRKNKEVSPTPAAKRSTSVGDVVAEIGGSTLLCEGYGWSKIPEKE